jgi:hypothetical protein
MKAITKLTGILLISLLAMSCATGPFKVEDKYNFDKELPQVEELRDFRIDSWNEIDNQSLILRANVNDYYLIILDRPAVDLTYAEDIGLSVTTGMVRKDFDNVYVETPTGVEPYIIHRMYKLENREQSTEIKKRLKSE